MVTGRCKAEGFCWWPSSCCVLARVGVLVLLAVVLTGCAGLLGEPMTPEQVVAKRAQARWDALVAGEWETAYSFATPAYRAVVDAQRFQRSHGGQPSWLGAKVRDVRCREDVCDATVRLKYSSPLPPRSHAIETDYIERWILDGGNWWIYLKP